MLKTWLEQISVSYDYNYNYGQAGGAEGAED